MRLSTRLSLSLLSILQTCLFPSSLVPHLVIPFPSNLLYWVKHLSMENEQIFLILKSKKCTSNFKKVSAALCYLPLAKAHSSFNPKHLEKNTLQFPLSGLHVMWVRTFQTSLQEVSQHPRSSAPKSKFIIMFTLATNLLPSPSFLL